MKTILCYGDSNTWGYDPATEARFPFDVRWTGQLRTDLGLGYWVIEEGLNGRTTVLDDPIEPGRSGIAYLAPCLLSHAPLDLILIMLGTNDCKARFSLPAPDIAAGAARLVDVVLKSGAGPNGGAPKVLLIAPPPIAPLAGTRFAEMFAGAEAKAARFGALYAAAAAEYGVAFLNAGDVIKSSPLDAIHFEADEHRKLGEALAERVRALLMA
jgi:lysophospholipase L1-like esterase